MLSIIWLVVTDWLHSFLRKCLLNNQVKITIICLSVVLLSKNVPLKKKTTTETSWAHNSSNHTQCFSWRRPLYFGMQRFTHTSYFIRHIKGQYLIKLIIFNWAIRGIKQNCSFSPHAVKNIMTTNIASCSC